LILGDYVASRVHLIQIKLPVLPSQFSDGQIFQPVGHVAIGFSDWIISLTVILGPAGTVIAWIALGA